MNNLTRSWEPLLLNEPVDIIAPASASTDEVLNQGMAWLREIGLVPRMPEKMINTDLFFAAPLEEQWEFFKDALYSDSKVMWCLRGGYGSMRLLPLLETLTPPKKPKLLIGFSDITSLHLFFNQKWNWPTLHGRTISQLKPGHNQDEEHQLLVDLLFGIRKEIEFNDLIPINDQAKKSRLIEGTITGGNLRLLQSSIGTPWQMSPKGKILFIEDIYERGYSVDRMLEQLLLAKIIDQDLKALVIGDFNEGLEKNGENLVPIALERFAKKVPYPVLKGLPCGHRPGVNYPLPFNTPAKLYLGDSAKLVCQTNNW
jgi:muramoyltetrapeptide carboxypeptidase